MSTLPEVTVISRSHMTWSSLTAPNFERVFLIVVEYLPDLVCMCKSYYVNTYNADYRSALHIALWNNEHVLSTFNVLMSTFSVCATAPNAWLLNAQLPHITGSHPRLNIPWPSEPWGIAVSIVISHRKISIICSWSVIGALLRRSSPIPHRPRPSNIHTQLPAGYDATSLSRRSGFQRDNTRRQRALPARQAFRSIR